MTAFYTLSGRTLQSDTPLDLPPASPAENPIVFSCAPGTDPAALTPAWFHHVEDPEGEGAWLSMGTLDDGYLLDYPGIARFVVSRSGRRVVAHPSVGTPAGTIRHLFLAQVWPMLLANRGTLVLHASAIRVADRAVAFLGESGWGKSTLAASFASHGCPLVTDDILVVERQQGPPLVHPSYPEQRLWRDSAAALHLDDGSPVAHYTDKLSLEPAAATTTFGTDPLRLQHLYVLPDPKQPPPVTGVEAERLSPRQSVALLLRQTFRLDITDHSRLATELGHLAHLVDHVPVSRLRYARSFDALDDLRGFVLAHLDASPE